jgi:hypothetical protein
VAGITLDQAEAHLTAWQIEVVSFDDVLMDLIEMAALATEE